MCVGLVSSEFPECNPVFLLLAFQILAQQDEIARLKKQEKKQIEADLERIKGGEQYIFLKCILYAFSCILRK